METPPGSTKALWQLLSPHAPKKSAFVYLTLLVLLATGLELILPLYSSYLIDSISIEGIDNIILLGLIAIVITTAILKAC